MIKCKNCNTQLEDGTRFCYNCGANVAETKNCKQCGTEINDDFAFCQNCGAPVADNAPAPATNNIPAQEPSPVPTPIPMPAPTPAPVPMPAQEAVPAPIPTSGTMSAPMPSQKPIDMTSPMPAPMPTPMPAYKEQAVKEKKSGSLLPKILIGVAALAVIVVLAVLVPKVFKGGKGSGNELFYLKDNELNYTSLSSIKPKEITDDLNSDGSVESYHASNITGMLALTQNGKRLFYPDKLSYGDRGITLYYRELSSKKEGEKLDSEIMAYDINEDGSKVYYIKGYDRNLYLHNLKDKEKIDNEVREFYINDAGSKLIYVTTDGDLYVKDGKKDKEKIDSDAYIKYVSDDLDTIFYMKEDTLYMKEGSKAKEKIASEIYNVLKVYSTGEVYYLKSNEVVYKLVDYVIDDLAESDAAIVQPVEPIYPYYEDCRPNMDYPIEPYYYDFTDYWGYIDWDAYDLAYAEYQAQVSAYNAEWDANYNAATEKYYEDYEAYQEAYNAYYAKQDRDYIREQIQYESITSSKYSLYYYDTKESKLITESYSTYRDYGYENPIIIYENYKDSDIKKVKMSEISSYNDVYYMVSDALNTSTDMYVAIKSTPVLFEAKEGSNFWINDEGNMIYYLDDYSIKDNSWDLYTVKVAGNKLDKPAKFDEEVNNFYLYDDGRVVYFKDVKNSSGDMYIDKKKVDSDVYSYYVVQIPDSDSYVYYVDYNSSKERGTLKLYNGKKSIKIADDIHDFYAFGEKKIVYLQDYNISREKGDLFLYNGSSKPKAIDQGVTAIIPIYDLSHYTENGLGY